MSRIKDLLAYYLECVDLDRQKGISVNIKPGSIEYVEVDDFFHPADKESVRKLSQKAGADKGRITVFLGYPCMVVGDLKGGKVAAPIFTWQVDCSGGAFSIDYATPELNPFVIGQYVDNSEESLSQELSHLENILGLRDENIPPLEELLKRLRIQRAWNWKEPPNPCVLHKDPPLSTAFADGIYNKALVVAGAQSPYTAGLSVELEKLLGMPDAQFAGTALEKLFVRNGEADKGRPSDESQLLEVIPMNDEQKQAVASALYNPVTIISGPPGTGKSQVVASLAVNAIFQSKPLLFASKNNKAVDVVGDRVNGLAARPVMLRLGGGAHGNQMKPFADSLLAYRIDTSYQETLDHAFREWRNAVAHRERLEQELKTIIELRNRVDALEQSVEPLRTSLNVGMGKYGDSDIQALRQNLSAYQDAYRRLWEKTHDLWGTLFPGRPQKKYGPSLDEAGKQLHDACAKLGKPIMIPPFRKESAVEKEQLTTEVDSWIDELWRMNEYWTALQGLRQARPIEAIETEIGQAEREIVAAASRYWADWVNKRPVSLTKDDERDLARFQTVCRMMNGHDQDPELQRKYKLMQGLLAKYYSCWSVTSLSAQGRIPLQPAMYDLLVIDEASQCDIASAIPLLFRAKRVAIIGDKEQLRHITKLSSLQDRKLLDAHKVDYLYAYTTNSLFDVARISETPAKPIILRDHHRSCKEIIGYSNHEFYDGVLRIATHYRNLKYPAGMHPGIFWVECSKGVAFKPKNGSLTNAAEADEVIAQLKKMVDVGFSGSLGVITPFQAQVNLIRKRLAMMQDLQTVLQTQNKLIVDSVHGFQGDERDVIVFSPVIAPGASESSIQFLHATENIFNVAVTRARSVLVVVGNASYCSVCGIPYLEHFVAYVKHLQTDRMPPIHMALEREYPAVKHPEQVSDWERWFYTDLFDAGIKTVPQYPVDVYTLDLALLLEDGSRLDIEIDGESYHRSWNGERCYSDLLRTRYLEEEGWAVMRFWVYQIRDQRDWCISQVQAWKKAHEARSCRKEQMGRNALPYAQMQKYGEGV